MRARPCSWEAVERRADWHLFDPHEVKQAKGWYLQDFYDETRGAGSFRDRYAELVADERISRRTVKAIDLFKRIMLSQLETGNPFLFYRDEVNRRNPNKHAGMIYSSNLCTEILQNMRPDADDPGDRQAATRSSPRAAPVTSWSATCLRSTSAGQSVRRMTCWPPMCWSAGSRSRCACSTT